MDVATGFTLDRKLEADSECVLWLGLCELRVVDDSRWPWFILVPQRPGIEEIHQLTPLDQAMLTFETAMVSETLQRVTGCDTINTAALGNVVRQLHVHIIARNEGDTNWPDPVWGLAGATPWPREALHRLVDKFRSAL